MDFVFEGEDEDAAIQFMIQQSLIESRPKELLVPHTSCDEDENLILTAIKKGNEKLLRTLSMNLKGQFDQSDARGWTPLHEAAAQTNHNILELTIKAVGRGSLERRSVIGQTALHVAIEKGFIENAALLLKHGANPDAPDQEEDTPIFTAIRSGRSDLVELLLNSGSNVNQVGCHGRCPLHEASKLGNSHLVDLLLKSGARPDPRSNYGLTPLALAAQGGHRKVIESLLRKGADVQSQANDEASILYEASAHGDPEVIRLLMEYGADANVPKHTGHLPIHRVAHRGHLQALLTLIPVTSKSEVADSGMSPLHSAAAGGHTHCIKALLEAGYDPNYMLHPWVRRSYDDERKSALFFAVSNNDVPSARALLEAGAMANQDPVKCLQVALRMGNYELIHLLLSFGANVNYFCKVNTTHFPSALQYVMKDEVMMRMLCNFGYDVLTCFHCPYGSGSHVPLNYEGWSDAVIKDTMFCEVMCVSSLKYLSGHVVRVLLDYLDHVTFCSKLKAVLMETEQWPEICAIQENPRSLQHLCRLRIRHCLGRLRLRSATFMSFLPLPKKLKDFILFKEYELYKGPS
ncbi:dynein axonemal heavy chain 12 [Boleophthalmus pectinirostris]|uniref:dynein axonemal heavy chain 12 n=1 Tax=Boleophthalmus pectinirostris TaxID=150288 RepID=UPI00242D447B|nr:dynein axonemal heavy chain 12 [Boleophthalmus pectinirostris]